MIVPNVSHSTDPLTCATFLVVAFVMAGIVQTWWLRSRLSQNWFGAPLDAGWTLGGQRILGHNKTYRGFVGMIPAVGGSFVLLRVVMDWLPIETTDGLWPLSVPAYGLLGCWVGFGFMAGELPNSFVKRRLGIPPGAAPRNPRAKSVCFLVDRLDSIAGGLAALAVVVPIPPQTWSVILLVGPGFHWSFSLLLFQLGVKARAA